MKIQYGLKNVHYAKITEGADGTILYGTPKKIPGAVNLTLNAEAERTDIPADDIPDYVTTYNNNGYEGELEVQILTDEFRRDILGETTDENGILVENADAVPTNAAFMFEITTDKNKVRHLMYNCSITKPGLETSTKGKSIENKTDKLTFNARPAKDTGDIKAKVYSDNEKYDTWFDEVYLKGGTPAVLVTPTDVTFDKKTSNQKDLIFNLLPAGSETLSNIKNGGTALTSTTHYTNTSNVVTVKSSYLSTLGVGIVPLLFTFSNSQTRTVYINVINTASE